MVLPLAPMAGLLPQLLKKAVQQPPPDMSTIPGAGLPQHQSTPSPYPPEGYIPPLDPAVVRVGSLPQDPEAKAYEAADAAAAAGPVGLPPQIPPLQPPQPPQMPSQDPFAIPQGPPSPIDIQQMPHTPSPPSALERVQGMPDPLQPHGGTGPRFGGPTPTLQGLRQDAMKSPPPRTPQSPYNPGGRLNPSPPTRQQRVEQANRPFPL